MVQTGTRQPYGSRKLAIPHLAETNCNLDYTTNSRPFVYRVIFVGDS